MNPTVKNTLAVLGGWIIGSIVNLGLVQTGYALLPLPGVDDPQDMEAIAQVMPTVGIEYFIFPFLAHALGTLCGALTAGWIAATRKMVMALLVGGVFLIGGIVASQVIPAPIWFVVSDLTLAYIPMAWWGGKLAQGLSRSARHSENHG
ncbi:MAG: hypothetical protein AAGE93_22285 [Bacteroidota bacterium]